MKSPQRNASILLLCLVILIPGVYALAQQKKRDAQPPSETNVTLEEASKLEAVITTDLGVIRFEFEPTKALKHTQQFIKLARSGFYDGSAFHRVILRGIIQGGDPQLKDPKTPRERWGGGALSQIADEFSDFKHVRGVVSTVRIPGQANSGGAQFFICASAQTQLDGQYSAFGLVTEGMDVVDKISAAPADANNVTVTPIKIISVKIEPKKLEPFKDATVDQMRKDVLLHTSLGDITLEMDPDLAPEHVRNFLKLVESGLVRSHRVSSNRARFCNSGRSGRNACGRKNSSGGQMGTQAQGRIQSDGASHTWSVIDGSRVRS
jgi:peptidyl-prolyl cis-trans isomerase B (cyclophilin B)